MDNILDRFGLYDFFGLLLPGMFLLLVADILGIPKILGVEYPTNEAIIVVAFILFSYVIGTVIQELASWLEKKVLNMREKAERNYLSDKESGCFSEDEKSKIKQVIKSKVDCDINNITGDNCKDAFFEFKTYMENNGKMEKADKFDAMFAMSRDLIICNFFIFISIFIAWKGNGEFKWIFALVFVYVIASFFLLYKRAWRYAKMRVRTVIRQYRSLIEEKNSTDNTVEENTSQPQDRRN